MTSIASELIWVKQLLANIGIETRDSMKIFSENQAVRHIAWNPIFHERTNHIEVDCYSIREKIQLNEIGFLYVKSGDQLMDILQNDWTRDYLKKIHKLRMIVIIPPT
jgi:hypothetical protein